MKTAPCYHWQDERGDWQMARHVETYFRLNTMEAVVDFEMKNGNLVQHLYSGKLEWVPADKLMPYPSEPIPEPTK
jgi:hypothetical protein